MPYHVRAFRLHSRERLPNRRPVGCGRGLAARQVSGVLLQARCLRVSSPIPSKLLDRRSSKTPLSELTSYYENTDLRKSVTTIFEMVCEAKELLLVRMR